MKKIMKSPYIHLRMSFMKNMKYVLGEQYTDRTCDHGDQFCPNVKANSLTANQHLVSKMVSTQGNFLFKRLLKAHQKLNKKHNGEKGTVDLG